MAGLGVSGVEATFRVVAVDGGQAADLDPLVATTLDRMIFAVRRRVARQAFVQRAA
jgi:hypothetical protein